MSQSALYIRIKPTELVHLQAHPQEALSLFNATTTEDHPLLDIDRSWQALQFILHEHATDNHAALRHVVMDSTILDIPEMDYSEESPVMFFTHQEVQSITEAFENLPEDRFAAYVHSSALQAAHIPPGRLWQDDTTARQYLAPY